MHKNRTRYSNVMLRFRRWARHSYSVFCSIGRKVTIGHLAPDVVDASLKKDRSIHSGYLSGDVGRITFMIFSGSDIGADQTLPGEAEPLLLCRLLFPAIAVHGRAESGCTEAGRFSEPCHSYTCNPYICKSYEDRRLFPAVCPFLVYMYFSSRIYLL